MTNSEKLEFSIQPMNRVGRTRGAQRAWALLLSLCTRGALLICFSFVGCSSTQRLDFYMPVPPPDITVRERGLGVVFVSEPFCVSVSEGSSAEISINSTGPAFVPVVPVGDTLSGSHPRDTFSLVIEIVGNGTPFPLSTRGLAIHFDDGSERTPTWVQASYFSTAQKSRWSPIGSRSKDLLTEYNHEAVKAYADLPASLDVLDTVRLTLTFATQNPIVNPVLLEFPVLSTSSGDWHMPRITFSRVTRIKYNPGGGVMADGVVAGSHPVSLCRQLGHPHS